MSTNPFSRALAGNQTANPFTAALGGGGVASTAEPGFWQGKTPLNFIPQFVGNLAKGLGRAALGITDLIGAAGHDIIAGVEELIPGEQAAEAEGYKLAMIGRNFWPSLKSDYAKRYGGVDNILRGLYEDPFGYISDALIVAGGVGTVAKAGRVGTFLGKLPPIIGDSTAAKILGATEATKWRAAVSLKNMELAPGLTETIRVSANPATRFLQKEAWKALSFDPAKSKMEFLTRLDDIDYAKKTALIQDATTKGIRVLRPHVGSFMADSRVSLVLSKARQNVNILSDEARAEYEARVKGFDAESTAMTYQIETGSATELVRPTYEPVGIGTPLSPSTPDFLAPTWSGPGSPEGTLGALRGLKDKYGDAFHHSDISVPHIQRATGTPEELYRKGILNQYTLSVPSVDDFERVAQEALDTIGFRNAGVRNYMDDSVLYEGYHVAGVSPDGTQTIDISMVTPELLSAQKGFDPIFRHIADLDIEKLDIEEAILAETAKPMLGTLPDGKPVPGGLNPAELIRLKKWNDIWEGEKLAAEATAEDLFKVHRAYYWHDHGSPVSKETLAAEGHRVDQWNGTSDKFLQFEERPMTVWQERAYLHQRFFEYSQMLADWQFSFRSIFSQKGDITEALRNEFRMWDIPEAKIDDILGGRRWLGGKGKGSAIASQKLLRRLQNRLFDEMVLEGGSALNTNGFPAFDWRYMRTQRLEEGLPTPIYVPDIPDRVAEGLGMTARKTPLPHRPGITKENTLNLLREGRVLQDPAEALSIAARQLISYDEMKAAFNKIVKETAFEPTPDQLLAWKGNQYSSHVLTSPELLNVHLDLAGKIMADGLMGVSRGEGIEQAMLNAFDAIRGKALGDGAHAITTGKIVAIPRSALRSFERDLKTRFGHAMRTYWDGPVNLWKSAVLTFSPRWLINNLFGNQVFMAIENPGALRHGLSMMDKKNRAFVEEVWGAWTSEIERGFFTDAQRFGSTIPDDAGGLLGKAKALQESRFGKRMHQTSEWVRSKNNAFEQADRLGVAVNELQRRTIDGWVQGFHGHYNIIERALREGDITPSIMDDVIKGVNRTLGDYTHYGPIERNVLRRFLVPFWGFYRHAAKVMLRMPFEHPLKFTAFSLIEQIDREMEPELPDWMRGRVTLGDLDGDKLLLNLQNLNPLSNFGEHIPMVSLLNPVVKIALERSLGIDTFTGEDFATPDDVVELWNGDYWKIEKDGAGNVIGVTQMNGRPIPDLMTHILQQFPQLQMIPTFQRYPKSTILQLASYAGIPLSQIDVTGMIQRGQESEAAALTAAENKVYGDTDTNPFSRALGAG